MNEIIKANKISYQYGQGDAAFWALKSVSFSIAAGELVILTGASGSGKTTLMTLIGALRAMQQGKLRVLQQALEQAKASDLVALRRQIGFIFQDHHLFDALNATETLALAMRLFPSRYKRQDYQQKPLALLQQLQLKGKEKHKPEQLSTGQKQRVAIARALINQPKLILADEPTASLDKKNTDLVMAILQQHCQNNQAAVLMVSHDQRLFALADRVLTMEDGKIIAEQASCAI